MSVAKCHNYAGCLLAYRGELIPVAPDKPLVCPECGKPMTIVKQRSPLGSILLFLLVIAAIGAAVWFGRGSLQSILKPYLEPRATPPPGADTPPRQSNHTTANNPPAATPAVVPKTPDAEPAAPLTRPKEIDTDLAHARNEEARQEVLKRIDLIPNISQANRDKLYKSVNRARAMGLVLTIPFPAGRISLTPSQIADLKTELERADVTKFRDDPTAVFVILGYADPKGDDRKNLEISQKRADLVVEAMRDRCGVQNVLHAVGMGSQKLLDSENLEKNRVAEIWVALP